MHIASAVYVLVFWPSGVGGRPQLLDQGLNLHPLTWEGEVPASGLSGKSPKSSVLHGYEFLWLKGFPPFQMGRRDQLTALGEGCSWNGDSPGFLLILPSSPHHSALSPRPSLQMRKCERRVESFLCMSTDYSSSYLHRIPSLSST